MKRNEGMLGIAIALLLLGVAGCGENRFQKEVSVEASAVKLAREVQRGEYDLLTTEELKQFLDKKADIVLIDAMPYERSYKKQHIPSAKHFLFPVADDMPKWDAQQTGGKTKEQYKALLGPDKDKLVVVYCGFVKCTRSHIGATWAKKLGYTNVKRYPGGIYAWKGMGFSVESTE